MEKNFRKNPHRESHIQNAPQLVGTTLDKRINIWADGVPVGIAMDRLKDCIQQGLDKKMLFIRYEDLMENPENEMKRAQGERLFAILQPRFVCIVFHRSVSL